MTWHLKDRELEKKLIKTCPNFIECIEDAIQTKEKDTNYIYVEFDREREEDTLGFNYLYFWDDELEDIPEYNPKTWNSYPEVIPPENVLMRVECDNNMHTALIYKNNHWQFESGEHFSSFEKIYKVKRFRPWED